MHICCICKQYNYKRLCIALALDLLVVDMTCNMFLRIKKKIKFLLHPSTCMTFGNYFDEEK